VFDVDLPGQTVTAPSGARFSFEIDPVRKRKLLEGLDAIGETLAREADISAFEARDALARPWLEDAAA
jgi:3-isopropylmalate dehydratase small subunit